MTIHVPFRVGAIAVALAVALFSGSRGLLANVDDGVGHGAPPALGLIEVNA